MQDDRPKVMVVDDNPGLLLTLSAIIEDEGYQVSETGDGYKAVELSREIPFRLIFLDVMMPGIDGVKTYRVIKKMSPETVVVMMTGFSAEALIEEALDEGAYAVIYKPLDLQKVIGILQEVIGAATVLVVDDHAVDRALLQAVLEGKGYSVEEAQDGPEAVAMTENRHYDMILMDIKIPGLNGLETFQKIRARDPLTKVIFVTAYAQESPIKEILRSEDYTVINKPFDIDRMLNLIGADSF